MGWRYHGIGRWVVIGAGARGFNRPEELKAREVKKAVS